MKSFIVFSGIFVCALLASCASATDILMEGGTSPDGKYEVRITQTSEKPSEYVIQIFSKGIKKALYQQNGTGYPTYQSAVEYTRALWHESGQFVVISEPDARHSQAVHVLEVSVDRVGLMVLPDYAQNAFGRVGAVGTERANMSTPKRWDGDRLVLDYSFTANHYLSYTCEVILELHHSETTVSGITLKSVSQSVGTGG